MNEGMAIEQALRNEMIIIRSTEMAVTQVVNLKELIYAREDGSMGRMSDLNVMEEVFQIYRVGLEGLLEEMERSMFWRNEMMGIMWMEMGEIISDR